MMLASRLFGRLKIPAIAKSTLGAIMFGIVGVALPLTMFSGGDQLTSVLKDARILGLGLCIAILIAKMLTYAVCQGCGFVGGPIFPLLFIGGTAGVSSTRQSLACCWDWRSAACSPPSWGRSRPRQLGCGGAVRRRGELAGRSTGPGSRHMQGRVDRIAFSQAHKVRSAAIFAARRPAGVHAPEMMRARTAPGRLDP
jgi:hypothetical protein